MTPPLRYAALWHTGVRVPHVDLLVETEPGSDLATWRLPTWPVSGPTPARRLPDHRRLYLDYEGEVSHDRGCVDRAAAGTCHVTVGPASVWTVRLLSGSTGTLTLRLVHGDAWEAVPV